MNRFFLFLFMTLSSLAHGQITYAVTNEKKIYKINDDYSATYICTAGPTQHLINDIAIAPSGEMYGMAYNTLYKINLSTGATTLIAEFPPNFYVSLVCNNNYELFMINNLQKTLYKYNLQTNVITNVAYLGYETSGDLAFYKGQLIFQSYNNSASVYMVKSFNLQTNAIIDIMCQSFYFQLWGLANYGECDGGMVLAVNPANEFLEINFTTQSFTTHPFVLPNGQQIYGLARNDEYLGSLCPVQASTNLNCELSLSENSSLDKFAIFPNPVIDKLNFKSDSKISEIQIFDLMGKLVTESKGEKIEFVTVSNLPSGLYLVKATTNSGISTRKFLKQ